MSATPRSGRPRRVSKWNLKWSAAMKLPRVPGNLARLPWLTAAGVGVLGLAALSACLWAGTEWGRMRGTLAEQQRLYLRYRQLADQRTRIESSLEAYGAYLAVSASEDEAFRQLLRRIEQAAGQTNVQIVGLKPRPAQRSPETADYPVELECTASVEALAQFIHQLEYQPPLLRVERLRISPAHRDPQRLDSQLLITYTNLL